MPGRSYAVLLALATLLSAALTFAWIALARRRRIIDSPGGRRLHDRATPRGGGVSIALVFLAALAMAAVSGEFPSHWRYFVASVAVFAGIGFVDDLHQLSAPTKLAWQSLAAAVMALGYFALPLSLADALMFCSGVLAIAYVVNAWNFMDGSDGLIAVQAGLIAAVLALWPEQDEQVRPFAAVLTAACLGFLPFNLPRARVFLGDVGSHALGAATTALLLAALHHGTLRLAQALLLVSAVLFDSGLTLMRRACVGRTLWRAHREHLYQWAVRCGHSRLAVCIAYALWTLGATSLAWYLRAASAAVAWLALSALFAMAVLLYFSLRRHWLRHRRIALRMHR
jgi:UDP-N-acetylmuramyl pentapeptide phosphotransferase/UDP-N-acetylglucosamine-1-phosphate transferase